MDGPRSKNYVKARREITKWFQQPPAKLAKRGTGLRSLPKINPGTGKKYNLKKWENIKDMWEDVYGEIEIVSCSCNTSGHDLNPLRTSFLGQPKSACSKGMSERHEQHQDFWKPWVAKNNGAAFPTFFQVGKEDNALKLDDALDFLYFCQRSPGQLTITSSLVEKKEDVPAAPVKKVVRKIWGDSAAANHARNACRSVTVNPATCELKNLDVQAETNINTNGKYIYGCRWREAKGCSEIER